MFGLIGQEEQCQQLGLKRKINKIKRRRIGDKGESESESYQPDFHQIKKLGLPIKESKLSSGSWNLQENRIYYRFMEEFRADFQTQKNRRRTKVFYRLSKVLKKRTPDQCRSHHQKLQIKYHDHLDRIMEAVQQKIAEETANQLVEEEHVKTRDSLANKRTLATTDTNDDEDNLLVRLCVDLEEIAIW